MAIYIIIIFVSIIIIIVALSFYSNANKSKKTDSFKILDVDEKQSLENFIAQLQEDSILLTFDQINEYKDIIDDDLMKNFIVLHNLNKDQLIPVDAELLEIWKEEKKDYDLLNN